MKISKKYIFAIILVIILLIVAISATIKLKDTVPAMSIKTMEDSEVSELQKVELDVDNAVEVGQEKQELPEAEGIQEYLNIPNDEVTEVSSQTQSEKGIYYIKVNNAQNVVTIYSKDSNGNFTNPVKAMVCSIGTATPTSGVYTIPGGTWDRYIWGQMVGGVWAQYYVRIKGSILFHSVPYTSKDKSTLEYWEYDKLGTKASAGCIRLTVQDAKWIYDNVSAGSQVEFYSDSNPGPLGKPTAQKISDDEAVRGWDPTDPDSKNPWKTYNKEEIIEGFNDDNLKPLETID